MHIGPQKGGNNMIVSFWSNVHGQTATTTNLLAIAVMSVLYRRKRVAVMQSHFTLNNLDTPLTGENMQSFEHIGIDALLRDRKSSPLDEERIISDSISLLNKKLNLFPGTQKLHRAIFERDMMNVFTEIMKEVDSVHDLTLIDVNAGSNDIAYKINEASDVIVVNLSQNRAVVEDYMEKYTFPPEKTLFLIGSYDREAVINRKNLIRMHRPVITKKNLAVIPYNIGLLNALNDGKTIPFLNRNIGCRSGDQNFYFMDKVKKATDMIVDFRKEDSFADD